MKQNHKNIPIIKTNGDTLEFVNPEDLAIIIEKIEQAI